MTQIVKDTLRCLVCILFAIVTSMSMTGTSVNTPTVVASAAGLIVPNNAIATATASSKKLEAPIITAAISWDNLNIFAKP